MMSKRTTRKRRRDKLDEAGGQVGKQRTLRRQIRDTTRLLSRDGLPETVRLTKERVLKSLKKELAQKLEEKRNLKLAKKYRMVKFFEKTKVLRKLKSLYQGSPEERAGMEETVSRLRVELNYIVHFPKGRKYAALYPSSETGAKSIARREDLLLEISERVESGELPDASLKVEPGASASICSGPVRTRGATSAARDKPKSSGKSSISSKRVPVVEEAGYASDSSSAGPGRANDDDFFLDTGS